MKRLAILLVLGLTACEAQIKNAVKNNPEIVFQAIEEHPKEFVDIVNRAVQAAQKQAYDQHVTETKTQQEKDIKDPKKPFLEEKRRLSGSPRGKIVLVEYGDFQCPPCGMAYAGLKKFKEVHKDDVQFYYKNMPLDFHHMAMPSGKYYEAVFKQGADKAQKFYDYVFTHQRELDDSLLKKAVVIAGADPAKVERDMKSDSVKSQIEADIAEFNKLGFTGTPGLIINGVALEGAQSYDELERVLALTEARR